MKEFRRRKRNDHLVGEQNTLDYTRTKKPKYEGNLYEKFPPLTDEELIGWSGTRKRLFDSIREALPALGDQNAQEHSIEIEDALDKYEKLEQLIESEKKRSKKNESRIKKLISLNDKYRKRTNYLDLQLNENDLTEPQLLRKAKRFGRLHREYLKRQPREADKRTIDDLFNFLPKIRKFKSTIIWLNQLSVSKKRLNR